MSFSYSLNLHLPKISSLLPSVPGVSIKRHYIFMGSLPGVSIKPHYILMGSLPSLIKHSLSFDDHGIYGVP